MRITAFISLFFKRCRWTLSYILIVLMINSLFMWLPSIRILGVSAEGGDLFVGGIYIVRDFAQREIKHYVIIAMIIGGILSYFLADTSIALASMSAFFTAEFIDWLVFTFTRRPLSERLLLSSSISVPIDTIVFLAVMHTLTLPDFFVMSTSKYLGILILWGIWRKRNSPARMQNSLNNTVYGEV